MQGYRSFPCDNIPDYYLGIKIHPNGTFSEIFNGPGALVWEIIKDRSITKNNLHMISIEALSRINEKVPLIGKIQKRNIC